jgi:hypothetical protein
MSITDLAASYTTDAPWWAIVLFAAATVVPAVVIPWGLYMMFIGSRETKIRGQALAGTARILAVKQRGTVGNRVSPHVVCRIRLSVEIPGREPYEATARQNFTPWAMDMVVHTGKTVAVQVDAGDPQRVRIDMSRPATPSAMTATPSSVNVTVNKSSWPLQTEWSGSSLPEGIPDQVKSILQEAFKQTAGTGPVVSAADLLATGQRVPAVLRSFAPTGTTARSLGRTPSRPELIDAPHYLLEVEFRFAQLNSMTGRTVQAVPVTEVPKLAIGLPLTCAVDPADPSNRFVVDWPG